MKKEKNRIVVVHPDFHKRLKIASSIQGVSMVKYTEQLAKKQKDKKKNKIGDEGFDFGFY